MRLSKFEFASLLSSSIRSILHHSTNATSIEMLKNTSSAGRVNFLRTHRFELSCIFRKTKLAKRRSAELSAALPNYFAERAAMQQRELNELFRVGRRYLLIGILVLVVCLFGSQMARAHLGTGPMENVIAESLILVGWVANWKPIETFLYDWWPFKRRRDLYRRLAQAPVDIKPT